MENIKISGFSDEIDSNINVQFRVLKKLGIEYFEPRGINGTNIADISDEQLVQLKQEMLNFGIKASSIGSPIGKISICDDFESHIDKLKRVIYIAKELDCRYIRVFSFFIPQGEKAENFRDEVMRRMKVMTKLAEENDVILLHENEKDIYGDTAQRCADVFETVNSPNLRAVFDPANFVQVGQKTYPDAYQIMMPYIKYMHIKDACGEEIVPAGQGQGCIEEILKDLYANGYQGFLSLEPHLGSFEGLVSLELDDKMLKLPKSGEGTFSLAFNELNKILDKIH
ncbi:MAG: sugar phosphate isomerase/epimerase [Clostridia bacterium]|nr:sugar phosphate isomerase/epimerase [Clostridia bacterium]